MQGRWWCSSSITSGSLARARNNYWSHTAIFIAHLPVQFSPPRTNWVLALSFLQPHPTAWHLARPFHIGAPLLPLPPSAHHDIILRPHIHVTSCPVCLSYISPHAN